MTWHVILNVAKELVPKSFSPRKQFGPCLVCIVFLFFLFFLIMSFGFFISHLKFLLFWAIFEIAKLLTYF